MENHKYQIFKIHLKNDKTGNKFITTMLGNSLDEIKDFFNNFELKFGYKLGYSLVEVTGPISKDDFENDPDFNFKVHRIVNDLPWYVSNSFMFLVAVVTTIIGLGLLHFFGKL